VLLASTLDCVVTDTADIIVASEELAVFTIDVEAVPLLAGVLLVSELDCSIDESAE